MRKRHVSLFPPSERPALPVLPARSRSLARPNYYDVVPSNHLERLLWAEAERMSNLNVDDANFKSERAVVRVGEERSLLATLPEATFVRRYRQSFAS